MARCFASAFNLRGICRSGNCIVGFVCIRRARLITVTPLLCMLSARLRGGARMYAILQQLEQLVENVSSSCGQAIVSAFNCCTMHPSIGIVAGILGFIAALRAMCR